MFVFYILILIEKSDSVDSIVLSIKISVLFEQNSRLLVHTSIEIFTDRNGIIGNTCW